MAMMARMRSLAPWFIIAVGGLFVLFMVLSDSRVANLVAQRSNDVGSINGNKISYQEFSNIVEQYKTNQIKQTGQDIPESQMDAFREQVWENLVSQKLIEEKIKEIGLTVTDQEILDLIQGSNPPQIITQYFIDSTGNFNRQAYDEAIYNPKNKEAMLQTEEIVRQQLLQQKLTNYLNASIFVSETEIKNQFKEQNIKFSADYSFIDAFTIPDSSIKYSDDDLEKYFNENKEEFKIESQRKLKYVLFPTKASKDDSTGIFNNLKAIVEKVKNDTASFKTYVDIYSDNPYSKDTTTLSMLPKMFDENISKANKGDILGPYLTNEGYVVYKIDDIFSTKDELVRASHILIRTENNENEAKSQIDEIYNQLVKGADFEKLAKEKSQDGTAAKGGDLGWFGKGMMVPEFEKAAFSGKINTIQKPIKTQFGYHIIKVTGKTNSKYVVEKIVNSITPSATTMDRIYENANDFAYLADKNDFEEEASLMNYKIQETGFFREDAKVIPGLGSNNSLLKFAIDNKVNEVSSVFKVPAGYLVASVSEIVKPGYKTFEEVKEIIKRKVMNNFKFEEAKRITLKIKDYVTPSGDLSKANEIYSQARFSTVKNVAPSGAIPGVGRDIAFGEAALNSELNKISKPVKSSRGYFLLKVTERSNFDSTMYSIQKNSIRDNLINQKKAQVFTDWITSLKKDAEIEDNRHLFYR